MTKINSLSITGIRGVRKNLILPANGKSCLLYGDNAAGKSTLSDAIEWFYFNRVEHLSSEEIGRNGIEALRNIYLDDNDAASIDLKFDDPSCNCAKEIKIENDKLVTTSTNSSDDFAEYLMQSQQENLVLRYRDLVRFVILSKGEKLRYLSEIIGFSQVTKTRDVLQRVANSLSREITNKNFENNISLQQSQILEQFGQNVTSDGEFTKVVNSLIKDFNLGVTASSLPDVNEILKKIKKPDDSKESKQEAYLTKLQEKLVDYPVHLSELEKRYKEYRELFDGIVADLDKVKKLALDKLLSVGHELLLNKGHDEETCPLCLQDKSQSELISELHDRIAELEEAKLEDQKLKGAAAALESQISVTKLALSQVIQDSQSDESENSKRKDALTKIRDLVDKYEDTLKPTVLDGTSLTKDKELAIDQVPLVELAKDCKAALEEIRKKRTKDPKWDVQSKINIANHAYVQVLRLKKEQKAYEVQRDAMDEVFRRFVHAQKDALTSFLNSYSGEIDDIYQFLNPDERVENIRIVPLEKNGDLVGLTIEYDFLDEKSASPPAKYLSESLLNCLGLAAFLASAEAFNKRNKFLVLDDVISSYDSEHRKRFADLIIERYDDYQIILMTHEKSWFSIVANLAKKKGWNIHTIRYNDKDGTHLDQPPMTLREEIESQIAEGGGPGLGNNARKYLEQRLKTIAHNMEVKVAYRPNESNEDRMCHELLSELKSKLNRAKCGELKAEPVIDRLISSTNIGNKDSHDYFAAMEFGDLKAFWMDIEDFDKLFFCDDCSSFVSTKYLDPVEDKIRCRKGHLCYSWKK